MDWRVRFPCATRVTEACLFPNEYQNMIYLVTEISASPVTNVYEMERPYNIVTCRGVRVTKCRVLVWMIGFISSLVTHTLLITLTCAFNIGHTALSLIYTLSSSPLHTL
jgi:hypothetical protein